MDPTTYQEYEQDYNQCLSRVRSFLSSRARSLTSLRECDRLLAQARRCAISMETLVEEGGDAFQISESKRRVEREVAPLMQEVAIALREKETGEVTIERNRTELLRDGVGYDAPDLTGNEDGEMDVLIKNSDQLLLESQALCAESEIIGSGTLHTVGAQGEQLHSARNQLSVANSYIDQAQYLLKKMKRKALRNKRFLYCVILVLVIANFTAIIAIFKKHMK